MPPITPPITEQEVAEIGRYLNMTRIAILTNPYGPLTISFRRYPIAKPEQS